MDLVRCQCRKVLNMDVIVAKPSNYRKNSISPPWRSIFQPFFYSGVLLEVVFN